MTCTGRNGPEKIERAKQRTQPMILGSGKLRYGKRVVGEKEMVRFDGMVEFVKHFDSRSHAIILCARLRDAFSIKA